MKIIFLFLARVCVGAYVGGILMSSTYADEGAARQSAMTDSQTALSTEEGTVTTPLDMPVTNYSRAQSTMHNDAYKQFIKLQISLASGSKNSLGISSYEQAHAYYCALAGESHDPNAQFAMGWFYAMGKGVAVSQDIAARFFSLAAIQGHRDAMEWLDSGLGHPELATLPACMQKQGQSAAQVLFHKRGPVYQLVKKHAPVYGVDIDFAMAVIAVESGFNPKATSRKKAQGLMQLMPDT